MTTIRREDYITSNTAIDNYELNKENVLRIIKTEKLEESDINSIAFLKNCTFHNGRIEVDILSRLLKDAPDYARGFAGIAFRVKEDASAFESFYVRPTNGRNCTDPVRRQHGCQYFSYPAYTFSYFREKGITDYEAKTDIDLDEWIHIKADIHNGKAQFYVNDMNTPVLSVTDLKHGSNLSGSVGFFVDTGTEAFIRNFEIIKED